MFNGGLYGEDVQDNGSELIGAEVVHVVFGKGVIKELNNGNVYVDFSGRCSVFMYPEAFEKYLKFENAEYQLRALECLKKGKRKSPGGLKYDPVEDTPEYLAIKDELEALIEQKIGKRRHMGFCYIYWSTKRQLLKEKYGIDWRSPSELNPSVYFD